MGDKEGILRKKSCKMEKRQKKVKNVNVEERFRSIYRHRNTLLLLTLF